MGGQPVPLVVAIDLEPDDIRARPEQLHIWSGAEAALEWAEGRHHGWASASINWFVRSDVQTVEVLGRESPFARLQSRLRNRLAAGDEVGVHPHPYRWDGTTWRNDFASSAFAFACVEAAERDRLQHVGDSSVSMRWGDRVTHDSLHPKLAEMGVRFDLTAEPGRIAVPPRDGGRGRTAVVPWSRRRPAMGTCGVVHWPLTTVRRVDLHSPTTGRHAAAPFGSLDLVEDGWVHGWCADRAAPDGLPVDVELLVQGRVVATASADWIRPDIEQAGVASRCHGVRIAMDDRWRALPLHAFALRAAGVTEPLPGRPSDQRTERGADSTVEPLQFQTDPQDFVRALDMLLRTEPVLTLAVRSDTFVDAVYRHNLDTNTATLRAACADGRLTEPLPLHTAAAMVAPLPTIACP